MTKKELERGEIISKVLNQRMTQVKASEELGLSVRLVKRLCKNFKDQSMRLKKIG